MHTAEPLVTEPISFDVEIPIERFKMHKSQGTGHFPAELIQAGGKIFRVEVPNLLILFYCIQHFG
jgi:hypothetical protein